MKKSKILSLMLIPVAVLSAGCQDKQDPAEEENVPEEPVIIAPDTISFDWQHPYEEILKKFMDSEKYVPENEDSSDFSMFDICDINSDGVPELIISPDTDSLTKCKIYTFHGVSASETGELGTNGHIRYLADIGLLHDEYKSESMTMGKYVSYQGDELLPIMTYTDNTAAAASGSAIIHEINGESVTLPEYDKAIAQYDNEPYIYIGRKYSFSSRSLDYAVYCSESWRIVMNENQKSQCRDKLEEIFYDENTSKNTAFELCDLNGDDVPELIVSSGVSSEDSCRIFYFTNENILTELNGSYGSGGILSFDIEQNVFYSDINDETVFWSLKGNNFSASEYQSSGSIMEIGRKYLLNSANLAYMFTIEPKENEFSENTEVENG